MSLLENVKLAVNRIRQDVRGAATLKEWLGDGGEPVVHELAEARASTCVQCPQNVRRKRVETTIAEEIRKHEEARSQVNLRTSQDINLHTCETCGCYLKLKVWVPFKHLKEAEFPANCWYWREKQPGWGARPDTIAESPKVDITVDRQRALGDALMASSIASLLHKQGLRVGLWVAQGIREMFDHHPHFRTVDAPEGPCISLNGVFDRDEDRRTINRRAHYLAVAKIELRRYGINLEASTLPNATLAVTDYEKTMAAIDMLSMPRPIIAISPGSDHYTNRDVPLSMWSEVAKQLTGTPVWVGNRPAPPGIFDPGIRTIRRLMAFLSVSTACVSADTGPLHIAVALGIPTLAIEGPFLATSMLPSGEKWTAFHADIACIGCGDFFCKLPEGKDACTRVNPTLVAAKVKELLG